MSLTINTNINSLVAQRNVSGSQNALSTSMQRLSSGLRVNSAADDAAGLAIAQRMSAQARGMGVAQRNANDAISLSQTAEGALGQIGDMLQRMRELAVQSANGTNTSADRSALNNEFSQLQSEIDRVAKNTTFNGQQLLTGTAAFSFQIGANATTNDQISVSGVAINGTTTASGANDGALAAVIGTATNISAVGTAGSGATFDVYTGGSAGALDAIAKIDLALSQVNTARSTFGAAQNRFNSVISGLQVSQQNQIAAQGRIMDADFATETANMSRAQILQQAGTAMIAQANQMPQMVLKLLG